MTKQERNAIILQAVQTELQDKPYAKDVLEETFELWVQGLVAQGNQLLGGQMPQAAAQGEVPQETAGGEAPQEDSTASVMPPPVAQ